MINGEKILREKYPGLDEKQYQPASVDLTVGKIENFLSKKYHGIVNGEKIMPDYEDLRENAVSTNSGLTNVYTLQYNVPYLITTKEKIKIDKYSAQFYKPRSTLLRQGVILHSGWGDPGFNGHLSYIIQNLLPVDYYLQKGERFAQLVDIRVEGILDEYDGDYQESE